MTKGQVLCHCVIILIIMKITLITVGKLKEKYLASAVSEYVKRLGRYCTVNVVEVNDEKAPETISGAERKQIMDAEGERILSHVRDDAFVIALAIQGKTVSSEEMAAMIEDAMNSGKSHIQWIIGGSLGLSDKVLKRADLQLSFSRLTFPHQLMRVILLEQIYRSFRIIRHEPYHK